MTRIPSPGTEEFYAFVMDQLDELENLQFSFNRAKTTAEIDAVKAEMLKVVSRLDSRSSSWAREDLQDVYKQALRANGFDGAIPKNISARNLRHRKQAQEGFRRASGDIRRWVTAHSDEARVGRARSLLRKQLETATAAARRGDAEALKKVGQLEDQLGKLPKFIQTTDQPTVFYRDRKGRVVSQRTAKQYYDMAIQSAYSRTNNLGVIEGAPDNAYFLVGDGPDCGWRTHDDSDKANGKIVSKKEAAQAPLAHPVCQRTFQLADGPPGSRKLTQQMRSLFGTANKREITRLAKVAPLLKASTVIARMGYRVATSQVTKRMIMDIARENPGVLPQWVERRLAIWETDWASREKVFLAARAQTAQSFMDTDDFIRAEVTREFGSDDFINLPSYQTVPLRNDWQRLLDLDGRVQTKRDILQKIEEYGDFVAHRESLARTQLENLLSNRLAMEAQDEIFTLAAMRIPLNAPRGYGAFTRTQSAYKTARKVWEADPNRASIELLREIASELTFLPWPSANLGPFKYSVGLSSEGRQDLAEFLFKKFRAAATLRKYSDQELEWGKSLGLSLGKREITNDDLLRAMVPRLTGWAGKPVSFTIGIENGRVVPLFRVHPPGAIGRQFALRYRLRTGEVRNYMDELFNDYRVARSGSKRIAALAKVLREMDQDSTLAIEVFRGSPIRASIRLAGGHFESFGIHTGARFSWMEQTWRLYGKDLVRSKFYKDQYDELIAKGYTPKRALKEIKRSSIPDKFVRVVAPRIDSTTFFNDNGDEVNVIDALLRLYAWHGNTLEAARAAGISWDSYMKIFKKYPNDFRETLLRFERMGGLKVRSLQDIEVVRNEWNRGRARTRLNLALKAADEDEILHTNILRVSEGFEEWANYVDDSKVGDINAKSIEAFKKDVDDFYKAWASMTDVHPPTLFVDMNFDQADEVLGITYFQGNTISINPESVIRWLNETAGLARSFHDVGQFVNGEARTILYHEAGHYLARRADPLQYRRMWAHLIKDILQDDELGASEISLYLTKKGDLDLDFDPSGKMNYDMRAFDFMVKYFTEKTGQESNAEEFIMAEIKKRWSIYGASSPMELIAEAFADYMLNNASNTGSTIVGNFLLGKRVR